MRPGNKDTILQNAQIFTRRICFSGVRAQSISCLHIAHRRLKLKHRTQGPPCRPKSIGGLARSGPTSDGAKPCFTFIPRALATRWEIGGGGTRWNMPETEPAEGQGRPGKRREKGCDSRFIRRGRKGISRRRRRPPRRRRPAQVVMGDPDSQPVGSSSVVRRLLVVVNP